MFRHDSNLHMRKTDAGSGPRLERKQDPAEMAHVFPSLFSPHHGGASGRSTFSHVTLRRAVYHRDWKAMTFQGNMIVQSVLALKCLQL
jgi:hypothetical protein